MTDDENVNTDPVPTDGTITEEWVDENVTNPPVDDDSVTDCCCDKRITIDDGNYCVKMPRRLLTVKESIYFCDLMLDLIEWIPKFSYNYDRWYTLASSLRQYREGAYSILHEKEDVTITLDGDVNSDGDSI